MALTLPPEILALKTVVAETVTVLDAWAKTLDPGIDVRFSEYRCAPPRSAVGKNRGKSIEQLRDENPGPPCITVSATEKLTGQRVMRRIHLHTSKYQFKTAVEARVELALVNESQAKRRKDHVPTAAELAHDFDYELDVAQHHSLMGVLTPASVPDAAYVEGEKRIAELLDIIRGDWTTAFLDAVGTILSSATRTERSKSARSKLIQMAADRAIAAGTSTG